MSSGPSDVNAIGRLAEMLEESAYLMREAIQAAEEGQRGLAPSIVETVNPILKECGWELRKKP